MPSDTPDLAAKLDKLIAKATYKGHDGDKNIYKYSAEGTLHRAAPLLAAVARDAAAHRAAEALCREAYASDDKHQVESQVKAASIAMRKAERALDASLAALAKEIDNG